MTLSVNSAISSRSSIATVGLWAVDEMIYATSSGEISLGSGYLGPGSLGTSRAQHGSNIRTHMDKNRFKNLFMFFPPLPIQSQKLGEYL